jgi:hypothetical protein
LASGNWQKKESTAQALSSETPITYTKNASTTRISRPYGIAGKLFGLALHEVDVINYCGMAVVKVAVVLFFLFPYIAIRLVLRRST